MSSYIEANLCYGIELPKDWKETASKKHPDWFIIDPGFEDLIDFTDEDKLLKDLKDQFGCSLELRGMSEEDSHGEVLKIVEVGYAADRHDCLHIDISTLLVYPVWNTRISEALDYLGLSLADPSPSWCLFPWGG